MELKQQLGAVAPAGSGRYTAPLPVIKLGRFSGDEDGQLVLTDAVPGAELFGEGWVYLPENTACEAHAAGFYFAQFSAEDACQVFNVRAVPGVDTMARPAQLPPFSGEVIGSDGFEGALTIAQAVVPIAPEGARRGTLDIHMFALTNNPAAWFIVTLGEAQIAAAPFAAIFASENMNVHMHGRWYNNTTLIFSGAQTAVDTTIFSIAPSAGLQPCAMALNCEAEQVVVLLEFTVRWGGA